jgi:glutaminyl-peptide cyclotransferase
MKKKVQSGFTNLNLFRLIFIITCFFYSCKTEKKEDAPVVTTPARPSVIVPEFNADTAFAHIVKQVEFGPRVPNTPAHVATGDYLIQKLKDYGAEVIVQPANVRAFDGTILKIRNIIGSYNLQENYRILLCAHWDTRPFADHDTVDRHKPIQGANDGGSGVAVLLEIARQLNMSKPNVGVDIILFDGEDYGQPEDSPLPQVEDSYCLGSQYWARNPHIPGYRANFGILLDMVGARNATFTMEQISMQYAPFVVEKVWKTAQQLGYGNYFLFQKTGPVIDDHYYINKIARIPTIDIIHHDPTTRSRFFPHWHTHGDDLSVIDPNTLKAVGQTVLTVVFSER